MKKILWSTAKHDSKVCAITGEDGDIYVAFEGGTPLRARDLVKLWYEYTHKLGRIGWIDRAYEKKKRIIKKEFEDIGIQFVEKELNP